MSESKKGFDPMPQHGEPPAAPSRMRPMGAALVPAVRSMLSRGRGLTPRRAAVGTALLVSIFVWLHSQVQDGSLERQTQVLAQLAFVKLIDGRWDVAVLQSRLDPRTRTTAAVEVQDVKRVQQSLDDALAQASGHALRSSIAELKDGYAEKAQLVTRLQEASADSWQALEAAMRADAAVSGLVRTAWRDFPQRERLIAAENLVARVLTDAQQYHHAPTATHRDALENAAADLPQAHSLPRSVEAGLVKLESDVHQLLLLKPLEQRLIDRLSVLNTGERVDELAQSFRRGLTHAAAARTRYRTALVLYSAVVLGALAWLGTLAMRRYRSLEALCARQAHALADFQTHARADASHEAERTRDQRTNVRFIRRPRPTRD